MALELPQHIKDLTIPQSIDARGGFSALGNNFSNAVDDKDIQAAQQRRVSEQLNIKNVHDLGVSGEAGNAGVRASGSAVNAGVSRDEKARAEEKRKKEATERQMLLAALDQRIAHWDAQIEIGSGFAEDLANGKLPDLDANGEIADEKREKFIREYEERTGTIVDRSDGDSLSKAVNEQNAYLKQQRQADADMRKSIDRDSESYSLEAEADINTNQKTAFKDQVLLQEDDLVLDKSEAKQVADILDSSVDQEIEHFMQGYAAAQQMDSVVRLQAEKSLLTGLSEEALENIEFSEDTEHLFEPEYFADLDVNTEEHKASEPVDYQPTVQALGI